MKIQHIRNACAVIHFKNQKLLLDPCLNPKGSLPPYTLFRKPLQLNPIVDLPKNTDDFLGAITCALITHCRYGHFDHLDRTGVDFLTQKQVPVFCNIADEPYLKRRNIRTSGLILNRKNTFFSGTITPVPTKHGHGLIGKLMGSGAGYFIDLPDEKSLYISGDTVMTQTVEKVLEVLKPDISILNAGTAALDLGRPILMSIKEQLDFIKRAPYKVIAVHLDAFNHCLTSRAMLQEAVSKAGLAEKVVIPQDGQLLYL